MDNQEPQFVENSNTNILNNIDNYLQYIRDNINQIIIDDGLKYGDPMDKKKIYPDFTYTQFLYLLSRLYDRVYSQNLELLYDSYINKYNKVYNVQKVELAYDVYNKLCKYYNFNCTMEPFLDLIGIDYKVLMEWLSSGRSNLLKRIKTNAKNGIIAKFENSDAPLLQLAAANHKYGLTEQTSERTAEAAVEVLPDLLAISDPSGTKKALPFSDGD